jgi:hypothetical protein
MIRRRLPRRTRRKEWLLNRDRQNRRRRQKFRQKGPAPKQTVIVNKYTAESVIREHRRVSITLPVALDFDENYETTVSHLQIVRQAVKKQKLLRKILFDQIDYISPSAALVLASEVDRWNQRIKGRIRAVVPSWRPEIKQLLCEMGYFDLLKIPKPEFDESTKTTVFLKFTRGDVRDPNAGAIAKQFRIDVEAMVGASIKRHFLFEGLSEAITNVGQHAYLESTVFRQWWLSASIDRKEAKLSIIFYDQGVGIPTTLPRAKFFEGIKEFFNTWKDSEKIEAAMGGGRSATEKLERGKGLRNFFEFPMSYPLGTLSIYSLHGMYRLHWVDGKLKESATQKQDHENSIGGTLIEWSIKL